MNKSEFPGLSGASILITGGAGFIGSHLVDACIRSGAFVRILDNLSESHEPASKNNVTFIHADIRDAAQVAKAIDGADFVLHHAAVASVPRCSEEPRAAFEINSDAVANCLEPLRRSRSKAKIVFASSAAVYGSAKVPTRSSEADQPRPYSVYGMTKYSGECIIQAYRDVYGLDARIIRYANVFGPRQPRYIVYDMFRKVQAAHDTVEVIGSGLQQRDFIYVEDAVRYTLALLTNTESLQIANAGSGVATTVADIARAMCVEMGRPQLELKFSGQSWLGDVDYLLVDVRRIQALAGGPETSVSDGIRRFIEWMNTEKKSLAM